MTTWWSEQEERQHILDLADALAGALSECLRESMQGMSHEDRLSALYEWRRFRGTV